jgi:RimJ/RimL family protein N-acetyltransferase
LNFVVGFLDSKWSGGTTLAFINGRGKMVRSMNSKWRRGRKKLKSDRSIQMFGILNDKEMNIGTCGLTSIDLVHRSAEFSLLIAPDYHKNGYGRAALKQLLHYGFTHLGLHSIWGETFQGNPAFKLFLSLGMHDDGMLRERYFKNGRYLDAVAVSILDHEAAAQEWWEKESC